MSHCLAVTLAGCAGGTEHPTSWNQCNDLPSPSVKYSQEAGVGAAPTPLGGAIVAGTYDLIDETVYGASSLVSNTPPETYVFDATTFQGVALDYAADQGTWSTSGTTLTLTYACLCKASGGCQVPAAPSFGYTATPTQLVYYESYVNGGTMVQTFKKR